MNNISNVFHNRFGFHFNNILTRQNESILHSIYLHLPLLQWQDIHMVAARLQNKRFFADYPNAQPLIFIATNFHYHWIHCHWFSFWLLLIDFCLLFLAYWFRLLFSAISWYCNTHFTISAIILLFQQSFAIFASDFGQLKKLFKIRLKEVVWLNEVVRFKEVVWLKTSRASWNIR